MIGSVALIYDYGIGEIFSLLGRGKDNFEISKSESLEKFRLQVRGCSKRFRSQHC
jgi:hypothetical protein